jgi:hypothetical protein
MIDASSFHILNVLNKFDHYKFLGTCPSGKHFHTTHLTRNQWIFHFLTRYFYLLSKQSFTFSRSFHKGKLWGLYFKRDKLFVFIYFCLTISCQIPPLVSYFHHHLHNKLIFILLRSCTPRPPFFLGLIILAPLTSDF